MTDYEAAEAVRDGRLPSPTKFGDFHLFALRITGTGVAFRDSIGEWAVRDKDEWLTDEFVGRCAGLPVIFGHPDKGASLDSDQYRERAIGTIVLPYVQGDEVWGIAKIYDADAAELMQTTHRSTSPGVTPPKGSQASETKDGDKILVEGLPLILDHLAVCELGVWDKDGPPSGIRLDSKESKLSKSVEELEKEIDDQKRRADAAEAELADAKRRADAAEKEREDAKKKDEDEKSSVAAAEKEKQDGKKRDSRKDRHAKHDGNVLDCAKCDSEEAEEEKERKDAEKASKTPVDADRGTELHDSVKSLQEQLAVYDAEIKRLKAANQPLSFADRDEIAKAWNRADRVYQMLGDQAPQAIPGETPIAYRRRLANGLRAKTKSWQTYQFHDAQQLQDFALVEDAIYAEATAYAKNPPGDAMAGKLREIVTTNHGKTRVEFIGDSRAAWAPFMHPTKFAVTAINRPQGNVYR